MLGYYILFIKDNCFKFSNLTHNKKDNPETQRDSNLLKPLKNKGLSSNEFVKFAQNTLFKKRTFELGQLLDL